MAIELVSKMTKTPQTDKEVSRLRKYNLEYCINLKRIHLGKPSSARSS